MFFMLLMMLVAGYRKCCQSSSFLVVPIQNYGNMKRLGVQGTFHWIYALIKLSYFIMIRVCFTGTPTTIWIEYRKIRKK